MNLTMRAIYNLLMFIYTMIFPHHNIKIPHAENKVKFYLCTKKNIPDILINDTSFDNNVNNQFNPSLMNVFLIHGWNNNKNGLMVKTLKPVFLKKYDVNVFAVDWGEVAMNSNYFAVAKSVRTVGEVIGDFIKTMIVKHHISANNFYLLGHSIGAHICGIAGSRVNGHIKAIIGLDPSPLLFLNDRKVENLDKGDAQFVEILHTSKLAGSSKSLGHADYYINGALLQPDCPFSLMDSCSHQVVLNYYKKTLTHQLRFVNCKNYLYFLAGLCQENHKAYVGGFPVDYTANGNYYGNMPAGKFKIIYKTKTVCK